MKRMLVTALAFTAMASAAVAQQAEQAATIQPQRLPLIDQSTANFKAPVMERAAVESEFIWNSIILRRYENGRDVNRRDLTVPLLFAAQPGQPTTEMRGFGQYFHPRYFHPIYNGSIYNENTTRVSDVDSRFESDQEYIDQFKDAKNFTLHAVIFPFYRNPRNTPLNPGLVSFLKTSNININSTTYKRNGFTADRTTLPVARAIEIDQRALDTTVYASDQAPFDTLISYTVFEFLGEPGDDDAPLEFGQNEGLVLLYTNEFAPGVSQPIEAGDNREWQRAVGSDEYGRGEIEEDPNNPGQGIDNRSDPLDSSKTFGLVMYRSNNRDVIATAWSALRFGDRSANINLNTTFFGTVELSASNVRYHYGKDASSQGIGAVTPNPVREKANVPFSLTERSSIKLELYDVTGKHVQTLVDATYIPGNYSVDLRTENLVNGVYLLRMTAGEKVYSSKLTISK